MKKIALIILLVSCLTYAQKLETLKNGIEVQFSKEKVEGTEVVIEFNRPDCYGEIVETYLLENIMPIYAKKLSNNEIMVKANEQYITLISKKSNETLLSNLASQIIGNFNLPNNSDTQKLFTKDIKKITFDDPTEPGALKIANKTYFTAFPRPNMYRSYKNLNINLVANSVRKYLTTSSRIIVKGKINKSNFINSMDVLMKKYTIKNSNNQCQKIAEPTKPYLVYQANKKLNGAIDLLMLQQVEGVSAPQLEALKQEFSDAFEYITFDEGAYITIKKHFASEIKSDKNVKSNKDGSVTITKYSRESEKQLAAFLKSLQEACAKNAIKYDNFNIFTSGNPRGIYNTFGSDMVYYNEEGQITTNPFIVRMVTEISPKEVINNYYKNVAGPNDINAISNIRAYYKLVFNNNDIDLGVEILSELPFKRSRKIFYKNRNIATNVFDGKNGYFSNGNFNIEEYSKDQINEVFMEKSIFPERFYEEKDLQMIGVVEEANGKNYYKIQVKYPKYYIYEYYGEGTFYLYRKEFRKYDTNTLIKSIDYINYTQIKEYTIPNQLVIKDFEKSNDLEMSIRGFEVNTPIQNTDFTIDTDKIVAERVELAKKTKELSSIDEKYHLVYKVVDNEQDALNFRKQLVLNGYFHATYKFKNGRYEVYLQGYETKIQAEEAQQKLKSKYPNLTVVKIED